MSLCNPYSVDHVNKSKYRVDVWLLPSYNPSLTEPLITQPQFAYYGRYAVRAAVCRFFFCDKRTTDAIYRYTPPATPALTAGLLAS